MTPYRFALAGWLFFVASVFGYIGASAHTFTSEPVVWRGQPGSYVQT